MKIVYRQPAAITDPSAALHPSTAIYFPDQQLADSICSYSHSHHVSYLDAAVALNSMTPFPAPTPILQILDVVSIDGCRSSGCTDCSPSCPYFHNPDNPKTNYQRIHSLSNAQLTTFLRNVQDAPDLLFPPDDWLESMSDLSEPVWNNVFS